MQEVPVEQQDGGGAGEPVTPARKGFLENLGGRTRLILGASVAFLVLCLGAAAILGGVFSTTEKAAVPQSAPDTAESAAPTPRSASPVAESTAAPAPAPAPASPEPKVKRINTTTYGDWVYSCLENQSTKAVLCSIIQEISEQKTKKVVFLWRITQDGKGGLVGVWQTPDGVMLAAGVRIDAGTPKPVTIPFETCVGRRCQAVANLAPDFQETLSKTGKASARIVFRAGQPLDVPLSVKGLSDGLAALKAQTPPG